MLHSALFCVVFIYRQTLRWRWNGNDQHPHKEHLFPVISAHLPRLTDVRWPWLDLRSHTYLRPMVMAMCKQYPDWPGLGHISTFRARRQCPWIPNTGRNTVLTSCCISRKNRWSLSEENRHPLLQKFLVLSTAALWHNPYHAGFRVLPLLWVSLTPKRESSYASKIRTEKYFLGLGSCGDASYLPMLLSLFLFCCC